MFKVIPGKSASSGLLCRYTLQKKIERILYEHPMIAEVAVCHNQENILTAFIVPRDERLSPSELQKFLTERLAPEELPQIYHFVAEIPKSPSGKCPQAIEVLIL